jgi:hypothetical protein
VTCFLCCQEICNNIANFYLQDSPIHIIKM